MKLRKRARLPKKPSMEALENGAACRVGGPCHLYRRTFWLRRWAHDCCHGVCSDVVQYYDYYVPSWRGAPKDSVDYKTTTENVSIYGWGA